MGTDFFDSIATYWRIAGYIPYALAGAALLLLLLVFLIIRRIVRAARRRRELREGLDAARLEMAEVKVRLEERTAALADAEARLSLLERNILDLSRDKAGLTAELAAAERAGRERAELLERNEARLREAFGALSREALGRNNEMFLSLAKAQLGEFQKDAGAQLEARRSAVDALVKPIGDTLGKMGAALEAAEKARTADHASLVTVHASLAETTGRLVRAMHHSAARGRWGELQLRRVVEMAGMLEHCDFEEQVTTGQGAGRLRPDLIINLVGHRRIIVDAKAPMERYLEAHEAQNEEQEKELLRRHAKAVRAHIAELGGKAYWEQFPDTPEFVVMFFPNEGMFAEAMRADPGLMEFGVDSRVIPASPATLIALLRATAYGWQQERAAENARRIFDLGRQLFDRFTSEYRHMAGVGASLSKAVEHYNKAVASAERMLFPALRRFSDLAERDFFPPPEAVEETVRELPAGVSATTVTAVAAVTSGAGRTGGTTDKQHQERHSDE